MLLLLLPVHHLLLLKVIVFVERRGDGLGRAFAEEGRHLLGRLGAAAGVVRHGRALAGLENARDGLFEPEQGDDEHAKEEDAAADEEGPEARGAQVVLKLVARSREERAVLVGGVVVEDGADGGVDEERQCEDHDEDEPAEEGECREAAHATKEVTLDHRAEDKPDGHRKRQRGHRLVVHRLRKLLLVEDEHAVLVLLLAHDALGPRHAEARSGRRLAREEHEDTQDQNVDGPRHERAVLALGVHKLRRVLDALCVEPTLRCVAVTQLPVDVAAQARGGDGQ